MTATIITAVLAGLPGLITAIGALFLHNQNAAKISDLHAVVNRQTSSIELPRRS